MTTICASLDTTIGDYDPSTDPEKVFGTACVDLETSIGEAGSGAIDYGPFGRVCIDMTSVVGDTPPGSGPGVLDDWTDVNEAWDVLEFFGWPKPAATGYVANFGNQLVVVGEDAGAGEGRTFQMVRKSPVNLAGRQIIFRMDPHRFDVSQGWIEARTLSGDAGWYFDYELREDGSAMGIFLEVWNASGSSDETVLPYEPDGAHTWLRFWHDDATGEMGIDAAPFCGTWTTLISRGGGAGSKPSNLRMQHAAFALLDFNHPNPRLDYRMSSIYIDDYPLGDPEPE